MIKFVLLLFGFNPVVCFGQYHLISDQRLREYVKFFSDDSLRGRQNYKEGAATAALFISEEFKNIGLIPFPSHDGFIQRFNFDGSKVFPVPDTSSKFLANIIGVLEGSTRPHEVVIISAHYDHVGSSGNKKKDSIYNGANDNASGTAAVMELARYFAKQGKNERTIIFCAFGGEELGLLGSVFFAEFIQPQHVIAVLNIEMIGIPQFGKNRFFMTGADYSNLAKHVDNTIKGTGMKRRREPDVINRLFYRSDNYPFAQKYIPAHSFMSSDDEDNCYHKACDEFERLNIEHLSSMVKMIAMLATTIVQNQFTPSRLYIPAD